MAERLKTAEQIYAEHHYWPAKRGVRRLTLVVSHNALAGLLARALGDGPAWRALGAIGDQLNEEMSDPGARAEWREIYAEDDDGKAAEDV